MTAKQAMSWVSIGAGVIVIAISPLVKRLMHLDTLRDEQQGDLAGYREVGEREASGMFPDGESKSETRPL